MFIGRLLSLVLFAGVTVSAVFGWLIVKQKNQYKTDYFRTAEELKKTSEQLEESKVLLERTTKHLEEVKAELAQEKERAQKLDSDLKETQSQLADLQQKSANSSSLVDQHKSELDSLTAKLEEEKKANQEASEKIENLVKEKLALEESLAKATNELNRLKQASPAVARAVSMRTGIRGKIVSVNRNWNFVVLNIGEKDGLVENGELEVFRNKQFLGKIKIVSTEPSTAVADIVMDSLKGNIQPGDDVVN
ncbi:hypothetical protein EM20IM_00825 [Candidatus Methylacidiphilum infernorum]|uniref:Chromosome partition protein Smc n=1 Tax=Candidatus Methylacidiphilum infernorum TaxID=511746 RepID=A0ABX7PVV0_9BACT|nr:hypothetical protein [Candidatus Methylacidiphilum infernorum]QSR86950.1 hypothetical protein EM20IM_00825 [Candidatus Methylacidiphilum infernorum]